MPSSNKKLICRRDRASGATLRVNEYFKSLKITQDHPK